MEEEDEEVVVGGCQPPRQQSPCYQHDARDTEMNPSDDPVVAISLV